MAADNQDNELTFFSDDTLKMKILATDRALGVTKLDVEPLLSVAEDIITSLANPLSANNTNLMQGEKILSHSDDVHDPAAKIAKVLEYPINYTSYVITLKCAGGVEPNSLTLELLNLLSNYSRDAKVVIVYAAFAINYGEFWLFHQLQGPKNNQLANSIAKLMRFPDSTALDHDQLQMELKAILDVLTAVLKLTHCIIEFKEILSAVNISRQSPEILPIVVYWIIRSLVVCASALMNLFGDFNEDITKTSAETREALLSLASNLSAMLHPLRKQLKICEDKVEDDNKYSVLQSSMESADIDNFKILSALILSREDQMPLYNGAQKKNERIEVLRQKYVLLHISGLERLDILHVINREMRHDYEILWLPIVDPTTLMTPLQESLFYKLRNDMPWFSAAYPSFVHPVAIRYIREDLNFVSKPKVVILDPHGKLQRHDALPMMWIWGAKAFPFTEDRERELWEDKEWNFDLLANNIDPRIPEWINSNNVICLYGGDDIDWIRKFTLSARAAARAVNVSLEMLYVGRSNPRGRVRLCHEVITGELLSHIFPDEYEYYVVYFWERLSSMFFSKRQLGTQPDKDRIMKEVLTVLSYDSSDKGWAVFYQANSQMTMATFDRLVDALDNCPQWVNKVDHPDKFVTVLDNEIKTVRTPQIAKRLILPGEAGNIPERLVCSKCGRPLEK